MDFIYKIFVLAFLGAVPLPTILANFNDGNISKNSSTLFDNDGLIPRGLNETALPSASEENDESIKRNGKAIIFRPLFVYRQQHVKRHHISVPNENRENRRYFSIYPPYLNGQQYLYQPPLPITSPNWNKQGPQKNIYEKHFIWPYYWRKRKSSK